VASIEVDPKTWARIIEKAAEAGLTPQEYIAVAVQAYQQEVERGRARQSGADKP